jgi:hypothetical protein
LLTVKAAEMVCGPLGVSIRAWMEWEPSDHLAVSVGLAEPLLAVPAKSQGALFSVVVGVPDIDGLSSQNRTLDGPLEGSTNTYLVPESVDPSSGVGSDREEEALTIRA